jgi:hypothetical protein
LKVERKQAVKENENLKIKGRIFHKSPNKEVIAEMEEDNNKLRRSEK